MWALHACKCNGTLYHPPLYLPTTSINFIIPRCTEPLVNLFPILVCILESASHTVATVRLQVNSGYNGASD